MIVLWVTVLIVHQGYTLIPLMPVKHGEPATFTCALPQTEIRQREVNWYKQSIGASLKLILKVIITLQKPKIVKFEPEFSDSALEVNNDKIFSNLTILRTTQEDEGIYHCATVDWVTGAEWSGTYLIVKGNSAKTSNYDVVQQLTESDSVHLGDSVTLQCSVLSVSEDKTCLGDLNVFWLRAGSDQSHPGIIYTGGNGQDECENKGNTQRSCIYRFSKKIFSSDVGTYYCAVATCGEILFGNGTKLEIEQMEGFEFTALVIAVTGLVISLILNVVFICYRTPRVTRKQFEGMQNAPSQARHDNLCHQIADSTGGGNDLNYTALHFPGGTETKGKKKKRTNTEESLYSQVKL